MVALSTCAACSTGNHEKHAYWIQKPPPGVLGGLACDCPGPERCAGNGEKLLRALFGDEAMNVPTTPAPFPLTEADQPHGGTR